MWSGHAFVIFNVWLKLKLFFQQSFENVIHALVTSGLDYCNLLYYGINQSSMKRLQLVQNAAARLLTGMCKFQHNTLILTTLQWLPVKLVEYKMLTLVFKALHNLAPIYLAELLQTHKSMRPLRSSFLGTLSIPRSRLKHVAIEPLQLLVLHSGTNFRLPYPNNFLSIYF